MLMSKLCSCRAVPARMYRSLVVVIALTSCHHDNHAAVFCRTVSSDLAGINPLIAPTTYMCFDDRGACEDPGDAKQPRVACVSSGPPHWQCFTVGHLQSTKDPLNNASTCYPTATMCAASRMQPPADSDVVVGQCAATDAVYCRTGHHALMCNASEHDCDFERDVMEHAPGGDLDDAPSACARWSSAR